MCGIAGAVDLRGGRPFPPETLARMAAAIQHRGPDGEGFFLAPGVAMAARRLALVDPERGAQPAFNEAGDIVACCNGEIFDHDAVRAALVARGHRLRSRCDAELWPHLWEEHGEDLFAHARGQFALALWDARSRTLLLARDRVGICPLYVAEAGGWLLWGSESKALLASGMLDREVDARAIDHLFTFFCAPARRSFFAGIQPLAPGEYLLRRDGRRSTRRHSDLSFPEDGAAPPAASTAELTDQLDAALRRAIDRRLRADAPVAAYLSGGVDSSTVLAMAAAIQGAAPASFTIGFDGAGTDESDRAQQTAAALGSKLTVAATPSSSARSAPRCAPPTRRPRPRRCPGSRPSATRPCASTPSSPSSSASCSGPCGSSAMTCPRAPASRSPPRGSTTARSSTPRRWPSAPRGSWGAATRRTSTCPSAADPSAVSGAPSPSWRCASSSPP